MIKNLTHAFVGMVAFLGLGWWVVQPSQVAWLTHHKDAHLALAGALIVSALFVIVCLVKALKPAKAATRTTPSAALRGRR